MRGRAGAVGVKEDVGLARRTGVAGYVHLAKQVGILVNVGIVRLASETNTFRLCS